MYIQMFGNGDRTEDGPYASTAAHPTSCATWMRSHCDADMQKRPMMMTANPAGNISLAAFLITRPPYGYIGCAHSLALQQMYVYCATT